MTEVSSAASSATVRLSPLPDLRAFAAMFVLAVRQQVRGWRLVVLGLLFLLPGALAAVVYHTSPETFRRSSPGEILVFDFLLIMVPHALAPLAALLGSAGIIRDDVEEQTLTYLLLRPLPRTAIYALKLLAAVLVAAVLTVVFSVGTLLFIARLTGDLPAAGLPMQSLKIAAAFSLAEVVYCSLFALLSLFMRRALLVGVVYIILFEGILASFDTIARRLTVMYYFRVLVLRWLEPASGPAWKFNLKTAPAATDCVWILLVASLAMTVLGSLVFSAREFRMKTPEGA